jgi:hypothetical protein
MPEYWFYPLAGVFRQYEFLEEGACMADDFRMCRRASAFSRVEQITEM